MTEERAIEVLGIMKSQMKDFGMTARFEGLREMQETAVDVAVKSLSEIQRYRAIGTVEECREARERQRGKKPILSAPCKSINYYLCPNCNKILNINKPFCCDCGSGIDWSEEDVRKDKE